LLNLAIQKFLYGYCVVVYEKKPLYNDLVPHIVDGKYVTLEENPENIYADVYKPSVFINGKLINKEYTFILDTNSTPGCIISRKNVIAEEIKLCNIINKAATTILSRYGAMGIISKDTDDPTNLKRFQEETDKIQNLYQRYGLGPNQHQIIITDQNLKFVPIGLPINELMLPEFEQQAFQKICTALNMPIDIFPFYKESAFGNGGSKKQAIIDVYESVMTPQLTNDLTLISEHINITDFYYDIKQLEDEESTTAN